MISWIEQLVSSMHDCLTKYASNFQVLPFCSAVLRMSLRANSYLMHQMSFQKTEGGTGHMLEASHPGLCADPVP